MHRYTIAKLVLYSCHCAHVAVPRRIEHQMILILLPLCFHRLVFLHRFIFFKKLQLSETIWNFSKNKWGGCQRCWWWGRSLRPKFNASGWTLPKRRWSSWTCVHRYKIYLKEEKGKQKKLSKIMNVIINQLSMTPPWTHQARKFQLHHTLTTVNLKTLHDWYKGTSSTGTKEQVCLKVIKWNKWKMDENALFLTDHPWLGLQDSWIPGTWGSQPWPPTVDILHFHVNLASRKRGIGVSLPRHPMSNQPTEASTIHCLPPLPWLAPEITFKFSQMICNMAI